ncbi:MAG: nitroreductase family deazaflavin-dependent oxidoreductase [Dehalococcoidia bacterium]|nr:nitroreductase family deazaflavin-dependent oxidoreductase [Dehalococcoidia bacterium]
MTNLDKLDGSARDALTTDMVVDITTTGRRSGRPRRIEIWAHRIGDRVFITGSPGTRSWYANLVANPHMTFHLKQKVQADLPARARPVTDGAERGAVLSEIKAQSGFDQRQAMDVERWGEGSCLVEVAFSK